MCSAIALLLTAQEYGYGTMLEGGIGSSPSILRSSNICNMNIYIHAYPLVYHHDQSVSNATTPSS